MKQSNRTQNSIRNVKWAMVAYVVKFAIAFFFRMIFVRVLGNVYAGIDGLFTTILAVISLIELGYETAMAYLLYKPIAEGDTLQVHRIMGYYRKVSAGIGIATLALGLAAMGMLPVLVPNLPKIPQVRLIFLCIILNAALDNTFRYLRTFVRAQQRQYVFTLAHYLSGALMDGLQIAAVLLCKSYILCLLLQGAGLLLEFFWESRYIRRHYGDIYAKKVQAAPVKIRSAVKPYIRAVALHNAGKTLLIQADTLLVGTVGGVLQAGIYSNYKYIYYALNGVYKLLMESVAAGVGELGARRDMARSQQVFGAVQLAGAWLYGMSAVCLYVLYNPFITLWLGGEELFTASVIGAIAARFFISGCQKAVEIYRDALGLFVHDKWVGLAEAGLMLVLCALLHGLGLGIESVLYAMVLAALGTSCWITPRQLYKKGFAGKDMGGFFLRFGAYGLCTAAGCLLTSYVANLPGWSGLGGFVWQMAVCALLPNLLFLLCFGGTKEGRLLLTKLFGALRSRGAHKKVNKT